MTPFPSETLRRAAIRLVATLALLLSGAEGALSGTTPRLAALAGDDVVIDAGDPLRWFGSLGDAGHLLYLAAGEIRPGAPAGARFTQHGLACFGGREKDGAGVLAGLALFRDRPDRSWQILLGRRWGALDVTVSLARVAAEAELPAGEGDVAWRERDATLGLGVRWEISSELLVDAALDGTAARRHLAAPDGSGDLLVDEDGLAWTGGRLRAYVELGDRLVLVPLAAWSGSDRPDRVAEPSAVYRRIADTYDLRLALLVLPDPDTLWHVTLVRRFARTVLREPARLSNTVPTGTRRLGVWAVRAGWERRLSPWWSLRCGGTLSVADPDGSLPGAAAPPFTRCDVVVGASLHLGEVVLDVAAGDDPPGLPTPDEAGDPLTAPRAWTSVTLSAPF